MLADNGGSVCDDGRVVCGRPEGGAPDTWAVECWLRKLYGDWP